MNSKRPVFRPQDDAMRSVRLASLLCLAYLLPVMSGSAGAQTATDFSISGLAFSPDSQLLAACSGSNDPLGPVVIWSTSDWQVVRVHRAATGIYHVDFTQDGKNLAFGTKGGVVGVLELSSGKVLHEINAHSDAVFAVAYAPNGTALASASADRSIKLWNPSTGDLVRTLDGHSDAVYDVAISPDGKTLLSGSGDKETRLWSTKSGEVVSTFKPNDLIVRRVRFSQDGTYFLVSRFDGKTRVRLSQTGRLRAALNSGSRGADLSFDNKLVATSGQGTIADVYQVNLQEPAPDTQLRVASLISQFQSDIYDVREAAEKQLLAVGIPAEAQLHQAMTHDDAEIRVRARRLREKVLSPEPIARLRGHRGDVELVRFSPDGRFLVTACRGGDIKIWDASMFVEQKTLYLSAE